MSERRRKSRPKAEAAPPPPPRSRWGCVGRLMLLSAAICFAGALAGGAALALLYERHVVQEPGDHLGRDHIRAILVEESPVFYRDGRTRVGVFFADEHRAWIGWEELPRPWVIGIVAAEDGRFWRHPGLDPKHVARAMRDNFRAGTVVAGGSTLTQQTAKNLYYRPDRSMRAKGLDLEELEPALQAANARRCIPPLDTQEVRAIARDLQVKPESTNGRPVLTVPIR